MADVARIAMTNQGDQAGSGGVLVAGKEPAMELSAVGSFEPRVLERPAQFLAGGDQIPIGLIDLAMFKPAQHDKKKDKSSQQGDNSINPVARRLHSRVQNSIEGVDLKGGR